jgi:hypothetical protein
VFLVLLRYLPSPAVFIYCGFPKERRGKPRAVRLQFRLQLSWPAKRIGALPKGGRQLLLKLIARSERRHRRQQWRRHYWDMLKSERWKQLRAEIIAETGGSCEACGYLGRNRLHLHHKHYRTLGRETRRDVQLLCSWCHKKADAARVRTTQGSRLIRRLLPFPFRFF